MLTQDDVREIESLLIEKMEEIRKEKGISSSEWGRRAFPDAVAPEKKMRDFRNGRKNSLGVSDMIRLAEAIGIDPSQLFSAIFFEKNNK